MMDSQKIKDSLKYYQQHEKDNFFIQDLTAVQSKQNTPEGEKDLFDRFYTELSFGTGGIRGIVGAGSNRLNTLVVENVASGWAYYLKNQYNNSVDNPIKVVIAFDSRHFSKEFSKTIALILSSNGIRVYAYTNPRPTPQLSYTVRSLKAQSGMVITASHNPPAYNGIKIYGNDGGQLVAPHDEYVIQSITEAKKNHEVFSQSHKTLTLEDAKNKNLYVELDLSYDEAFYDYVESVLHIKNSDGSSKDLHYKTVYTPLHGTGALHIETLAKKYNFNVIIEPSQKEPNGDFPTVEYPNPEDPQALIRAINTAKKENANLVVANDPDADRVGLAERQSDGNFVCITGNQVGALLLDYIIFSGKKELQTSNKTLKNVFINTIVTTTLQNKIAKYHNIRCDRGYTGFKNIAEYMKKIDSNADEGFLFACEESYGYLASTNIRDKDGISIALLCIKMAQEYSTTHNNKKGITLMKRLDELYTQFGYHEERTINKTFLGKEGKDKIASIMKMLRENQPTVIGGQTIVSTEDYLKQTKIDKGVTQSLSLTPADVLIFITENDDRICVRPSGTEPKIKVYLLYNHKPTGLFDVEKKVVSAQIDVVIKEVNTWF